MAKKKGSPGEVHPIRRSRSKQLCRVKLSPDPPKAGKDLTVTVFRLENTTARATLPVRVSVLGQHGAATPQAPQSVAIPAASNKAQALVFPIAANALGAVVRVIACASDHYLVEDRVVAPGQ